MEAEHLDQTLHLRSCKFVKRSKNTVKISKTVRYYCNQGLVRNQTFFYIVRLIKLLFNALKKHNAIVSAAEM